MASNKETKEWTVELIRKLYRLRFEEKLSIREIAEKLDRSQSSVRKKIKRVDWDEFEDNPQGYVAGDKSNKPWDQAEMGILYAYLEDKKSYEFIASKIERGRIAVERKAQKTDWEAWKAAVGESPEALESGNTDEEVLAEQLKDALLLLCRRDIHRLQTINEKEFRRKVNFESDPLPVPFPKIVEKTESALEELGLKNPEEIALGEGTYVVVGDSHGKFTKTQVFDLLSQVDKFLKPTKIIHVGHLLDDDNDISYNWGKFKNLLVVSKIEELHLIQEQRHKFDLSYEIVRGGVSLGNDLMVMNQDMITDYVKTPIKSLDSAIFDQKSIVNCHRFEFFPQCSETNETAYVASPGALCEKHIIRTIKQIDFDDGRTVKQSNWSGYSKYRRMRHMFGYWKQGMMVVHVDKDGGHTIIPCLIQNVNGGYATSYFDKIITNKGVRNPSKKIFVTGDAHSPKHRNEILDISEQIVKDYKPDVFVNLGDAHDYESLNHHKMDRGININGDVLTDSAKTRHVVKRQATWAKSLYMLMGNHERFGTDFTDKFPQLASMLNFEFLCDIKGLGYKFIKLKESLKIESTAFIHGDVRMYGQTGSQLEKVSKTFGDAVFMGHVHYPSIRYGTFSVGLSGELDQEYNEPSASPWIHGIGLCNHYRGKSWPTTIAITNDTCRFLEKTYTPKNPSDWDMKSFSAKLIFETE